ncbi:MAG: hypothetical protein IJH32_03485 [Ruminococcus sp.]|nr:hypothetical protein [Ruminococcus sp.]
MNQIKEVYSRITVDDSVVDAAIKNAKQQKITRFSAGRIISFAASFAVVILAAGLVIFLLQTKNVDMTSRTADAGAADDIVVLEEEAPDDGAKTGSAGGSSKSAEAVMSYLSEEVPALGATEIRSGRTDLTVTYHVSKDESYDPAEITLSVFDANGAEARPVAGEDILSEDGGVFITERFSPVDGDRLTLKYYDGGMLIKEEEIILT